MYSFIQNTGLCNPFFENWPRKSGASDVSLGAIAPGLASGWQMWTEGQTGLGLMPIRAEPLPWAAAEEMQS